MEHKNSFWENMWLVLLVLIAISFIYNAIEAFIEAIKNGDWIKLIVWAVAFLLIYNFINNK